MLDAVIPKTDDLASFLVERYGESPGFKAPPIARSDRVLTTLIGHRSCRAYLNKDLPNGVLEVAIAAAQSAANSSNLQSWSVVAVTDRDLKTQLNALAGNQKHIAEAPLLLIWLADLGKLRAIATAENSSSEAIDYLEMLITGVVDVSLAAQAAAVAFENLGFGTCYIGGIRNHADKVASALNAPPEAFPVFGMTVGYPDPARPSRIKPRLAQTAVLHSDHYQASATLSAVPAYNQKLNQFQIAEGLPVSNWSRAVSARIASPSALHGREHLVASLRTLGFQLK